MTRHFCATHLGAVHYVQHGPATGTPIVLLHQTPRSIDEFTEIIPLLARTHRVIAIDTPGYGCSDHPAVQPTIEDYASAVIAVLDDAGIARAHIVGHHTGMLIAVELAATRPTRVASIVLSGPVYTDEKGRETLRPYFVQWQVQPDGSHLMEKWTKFSKWTSPAALVQRLLLDLFRAGETSEAGHFALLVYRMEDRLPLVHCPGLLIFGSRDPFADRSIEPIFLKQLSPGRALVLDMGVFGPNEQPDAFARAVLEFLGTLPG